jgi:major inositol transporter-like SP family MFS transporter
MAIAFATCFHVGRVPVSDPFGQPTGATTSGLVADFPGASYLVLALMMVFLAFQQGMISPVTWLMMSEIFPIRIRGLGIGVATFSMWTVNCCISFFFPVLLGAVGGAPTFAIFVCLNVAAVIFAIRNVPETRGRTLEALEAEFRSRFRDRPPGRRLAR